MVVLQIGLYRPLEGAPSGAIRHRCRWDGGCTYRALPSQTALAQSLSALFVAACALGVGGQLVHRGVEPGITAPSEFQYFSQIQPVMRTHLDALKLPVANESHQKWS